MNLNHELCYAAVQSRDDRFDGVFFTGVVTTGIFCRPVCPAKTPRSENVRFFSTAAAAAEAGFRPCLRCRPESAPESPEWNWSSAVVARAVRLIAEGTLDDGGMDELATRLHLGTRQLRRYFVRELGVPPIKIVQTHRLLFAKKLIDETVLPMADIAFIAGYASIRRFNDALQRTYGKSPTALRRESNTPHESSAADNTDLKLTLFYRPPYDWNAMMRFLRNHAIPGVESVEADGYRRAVRFGETAGIIRVRPVPEKRGIALYVPLHLAKYLRPITGRVKRMFDLRADPAIIERHLRTDPQLAAALQRHPGIRLPGAWDAFEAALYAVLARAENHASARCHMDQLVQQFGEPLAGCADASIHLFPTAKRLADAPLVDAGLSPSLATTVRALATALANEESAPRTASGLDDGVAQLVALPGVDEAAAHAIALRTFAEPDAFPVSDGVPWPVTDAAQPDTMPFTAAQLEQRTAAWRPWRAYAALVLWAENEFDLKRSEQ